MNESNELSRGVNASFPNTRWTMVLNARGDAPEARAALGELCEAYWTPVFRFLHREGRSEDDSRELAQEFFTRLLSGKGVVEVDPEKGRFRSYLLGALKHFLADRQRSKNRQKRGGDIEIVSIEAGGTDSSPGLPIADPAAQLSDASFDREWALSVMDRALSTTKERLDEAGKAQQFDALKAWLIGEADALSQSSAAEQLGMTVGAVKVAIHRLRKDFQNAIRSEIAQTVSDSDEVEEELRYLVEALA